MFFCIFLGLYDFSYHLNTTPAIKSHRALILLQARQTEKHHFIEKWCVFAKAALLHSATSSCSQPHLFQGFIFLLRRKGVARAIFRSTDSQSFVFPYSHQAECWLLVEYNVWHTPQHSDFQHHLKFP